MSCDKVTIKKNNSPQTFLNHNPTEVIKSLTNKNSIHVFQIEFISENFKRRSITSRVWSKNPTKYKMLNVFEKISKRRSDVFFSLE